MIAPASLGGLRLPVSRASLLVTVSAVSVALILALGGTLRVQAGIPVWTRFWGTVFFVLLLWPVGLSLLGRLAGIRVQAAAAAALLALTLVQQSGLGGMPLPLVVRWSVTLARPGEAIRQRIVLPPPADPAWQRALRRAASAAVAICTEAAVSPDAGISVSLDGRPGVPLASLERAGKLAETGWYYLPVETASLASLTRLDVEIRRERAGPPALFCGGQDDPGRRGAGGSTRLANGRWETEQLADLPLPPVLGRPALSRYYIELRLFDAAGMPWGGIWY